MPLRAAVFRLLHHDDADGERPHPDRARSEEDPEVVVPSPLECHDGVCDEARGRDSRKDLECDPEVACALDLRSFREVLGI